MKKTKPVTRKAFTKKTNLRKRKTSLLRRFSIKTYLAAVLAVSLVIGLGVSALLPASSPLAFNNLIGKYRDAPVRDTLSGNYSVVGEATSTSLLVKYKAKTSEATRANIHAQAGTKARRHIGQLGVDVVQVTSSDSVGEIMKKYKARSEVEYVEPNFLAKHFLTPNDSLFSKQWHLQKIEAPKAWDVSQGGFGPIAIIDTGIATNQADLSGAVQVGYNFVNDTTDTNDDNGHGTHVAGIVSATSNNGTGVASIGFKGTLLPVKVLDNTGAGTYGDVASGIVFAVDKGAKIINMSLGGSSSSRTLEEAVKYALARGLIIVAAAGNNSNSVPVYPAAYSGVVAVSASTEDDNLASFSSYGSNVYVSAPGVSITSTYHSGGYATLSGTSMATPAVSGLIGLALSRGTITPTTALSDLKTTSDKIGPYAYDSNGWNQYFGYGRINAAKLLATGTATEPTPTEETTSTQPSDKPKASSRSPAASLQFDVVVEGSVDSVDTGRSIIVVNVK
jgi:thermitase